MLAGKLTQSGVSESFRMRVPIYANFSGKPVAIGALNLNGNQTRDFRAPLPAQPKRVLLNASFDVLCADAEVKQSR